MKEYIWAIAIAVIQAVVTAVVTIALTNNWMFFGVMIGIDIIIFTPLFFYFRKKLKAELDSRNAMLKLYRNVGIDGCTEELQGTPFEPKQCMKNVNKYLDFMGVGGNKWIDQDDKLDLFKDMLKRVKAANGKVRYLLIDPRCDGYRRLKELRQNKVPSSSYRRFKKLVSKFDCLEVHFYDDLPSFRLQFVDQEYVAVSRYYIEHELHAQKNFGWRIPHLIVRAERLGDIQKGETEYQGTLYKSFEQLYEYIWTHSADIKDVDLESLFADE